MIIALLIIEALGDIEVFHDQCGDDHLCHEYAKALEISKIPVRERISKSLTYIEATADSDYVIMETATLLEYYPYEEDEEFQLYGETWFTAYPDNLNSCRNYNTDDIALRMKQQLGLPPTKTLTGVVQLYVNVKDIFRPCPDPEIFDSQCTLGIPVENKENSESEIPWYCPSEGEEVDEVGEKWSEVSNDHYTWMCNSWTKLHTNSDVYSNYPWTGLGYTYDWGSPDGFGLSEFVVPGGTTVYFIAKYTIDEYCSS